MTSLSCGRRTKRTMWSSRLNLPPDRRELLQTCQPKHTKNHTKNHTKDHTKNHTKNHTKKKAPLFSTDLYISFEILQRFISRATQNTLAEEATSGCYIENFLKYTVSMRCGATFLKNTLSPCRTEIHQNKKPLNCRNRKQTEAKTKPNTKIF